MAYVHWYMKTGDEDALRYEDTLNSLKLNAIRKKSMDLFKTKVKKIYGQNIRDFISIGNKLIGGQNSVLKKGVDNAFKMLENFKALSQQGIKNIGKEIQNPSNLGNQTHKLFQIMDDFIAFSSGFYSNQSGQDFLAFLIADNNKQSRFISDEDKKLIKQIINTNEVRLFDRKDEEMQKGASEKFKSLNSEIKALKSGGFKTYVINQYNAQTGEGKKTLGEIISAYYTQMGQLAGFMFEALLDTCINIELVKSMKQAAPNGVHITAATAQGNLSNTDGKLSFKKPTVDLRLNARDGKINFVVPIGMSVKRSAHSNQDKLNANIKNSTIEKLLNICRAHGMWDEKKYGEAFYNVMANHGRHATKNEKGGGGGTYYYYGGQQSDNALSPLFKAMNQMFLIFGLAGSLKNDFASYIIVNNRIYSVYDILSRIGADGMSVGGLNSSLQKKVRASHRYKYLESLDGKEKIDIDSIEMAKERSTEIIQNILNQELSMKLDLNLRKLKLKSKI